MILERAILLKLTSRFFRVKGLYFGVPTCDDIE